MVHVWWPGKLLAGSTPQVAHVEGFFRLKKGSDSHLQSPQDPYWHFLLMVASSNPPKKDGFVLSCYQPWFFWKVGYSLPNVVQDFWTSKSFILSLLPESNDWEGVERSATFQPAFRRFESLQICFQDLAEQKSFSIQYIYYKNKQMKEDVETYRKVDR